ncbi:GNAT family N-acetyltransferase [Seonamhaeicola maritimus]|uniref:GNAT family N-acetyltransferase n=1 Tax=Seonamhaeicola maritimus TaxID=2591822 RepID=A0A5C7GM02_9FLAO|nr:GNAT family N-acetyltransferase [Seonamhaeicola maritimus]TXG39305.1 GNAT family N-acetyltransferase [Seonamhaeicola maritimus]
MSYSEEPLNNPVWSSLTDIHIKECIDYGNVKFYHPDFTPFGAFVNNHDTSKAIKEHSKLLDRFFIVGEKPIIPDTFRLTKHVGLQMIIYNEIDYPITSDIIELNQTHYNDLMNLISLVYPHFFKKKTNLLGRYFGIYKNDQLVAVAGERMQTKNFTEISAVATHPDHTGQGYAKQLITYAVKKIFEKNKNPFLHVDETNTGPIKLYKKLGFSVRRKIHYWLITSPQTND